MEDVSVLEVDERLATQDSDLVNLIKEDYANTWLILNVRRNGRLVWRVPVTLGISERSLFCEKGFNYYAYQNWYIDTTVRHKKIIIAAFLIMFDESMWFKEMRKYITSNFLFLMDGFEEDIEIIEFYNDAGLITIYRLKQLLENAIQKNNVEVAASILDLINCKSGFTAKSLQL
ncbi:MAG: hypothetical protein LBC41_17330 [Clostridiales bacterium]|nr:hypothetical protein [Clostridiales bacterium]